MASGAHAIRSLLLAASFGIPALFLAGAGYHSYHQTSLAADNAALDSLDVLYEHSSKVFDTHDLAIRLVQERIRGVPWDEIRDSVDIHRFLRQLAGRYPQIGSIWLIDPNGRGANTSHDQSATKFAFGDRDYFEHLSGGAETFISKTYVGKLTGTENFNLAARRGNGEFDGVVLVAASVDYFREVFSRVVGGHPGAFVALIRADGQPLVSHPQPGARLPLPPDSTFMRAIASADRGAYSATSRSDQVARRFVYRKLAHYPVYVAYGRSEREIMAAWRSTMMAYMGLAMLSAVVLAGLSMAANRRLREEEAVKAELEAMVAARTAELEKVAEERRRSHAGKMEALGNLAGGMAHELNNVLVPILGMSELAAREAPAEGRLRRQLAALQEAAKRAKDIVHQVMLFSRTDPLAAHPVLIAPVVRDALRLAGVMLPSTITLGSRITAEDVQVMADEVQIHQIILSLVNNAADAIGSGIGSIEVSLTERLIEGNAHSATGWLALTVKDDGCGMDEATQERVFQPFFTTKVVGQGVGMGLAVVHGIVANWGGTVKISSGCGQGTSVTVLLPAIVHGDGDADQMQTPPAEGAFVIQ